ncbi:MAG: sulfatase-like hydrolase/transferase, partial [Spirochaetales bacterium]|nr:sulfatase-like hydrolase/transferase [Spirochaetales bacterium]
MKTQDKPNVILFMVDQLSAKWLEAARNRKICELPNFDWLQSSGTTFTRAITSNPVCSPARATIATGLTSRAHGLIMNGYSLNPEIPTFMRELQKSGWRTGAFGKLHLKPHFEKFYQDYAVYGFDVVHNTEDDRSGVWLDWVKEDHPEHYEAVLATRWPDVPGYAEYGPDKIDMRPAIREAKKKYPDVFDKPLQFPEELSQSAWITSRALDYIKETDSDQPLFAHVSFVAPHPPYCPPAETMDKVAPENIPTPVPAEWLHSDDAPEYYRKLARFLNNETDKKPIWADTVIRRDPEGGPARPKVNFADSRHRYFADIVHLDQQLGRVRKALEETGRLASTYIIFTADHGELLGDHGFMQKQERHYDGSIRIPLAIAGPGLEKGA